MKAKAKFDGPTLVLPDWKFTNSDARVPHRRKVLAEYIKDQTRYYVCANRNKSLFWVHAVAPGFAGDNSRASNTVTTRNQETARLWVEAVRSGQVRIE